MLPELQTTSDTPPKGNASDLSAFLERNDCLKAPRKEDQVYCYKLTRYRLIQVTEMLDAAMDENWAARLTIKQLVANLNVVIDSLNTTSPSAPTETVK